MGNLGMDCHGAHTTDIIISVRLPTSPTWLLFSVPSSDQTSSKQFSCSCLTAPKHLSKIQIQHSNPQPPNHNQQPPHTHKTLPALHCLSSPPTPVPTASSTARLAQHIPTLKTTASSKPHIRNGRRQHNVLSGAAPFAAASLPRPTTKPPSACSPQAELNGFASMLLDN